MNEGQIVPGRAIVRQATTGLDCLSDAPGLTLSIPMMPIVEKSCCSGSDEGGRARVRRAWAMAAALLVGCGASSTDEMGTASCTPELSAVGATSLGLRYGEVGTLTARFVDCNGNPERGVTVHFSALGDTGGSTLSSAHAITAADGTVSVQVSAGAAETSFQVTAQATGAPDLEWNVAVSRFPFVALDVSLAYTGAGMGQVSMLQALLYDDRPCSRLAPSPTPPGSPARLDGQGSAAVLHFTALRAIDYAVVGRALDKSGHLLAFGCVDLDAQQLAVSGTASLPVPLQAVLPAITGSWQLLSTMPPLSGASPVEAWDALVACPVAQPILDAMVAALGPGKLADAVAAHRDAAGKNGCRPPTKNGASTLDGILETQMAKNGSPARQLPDVIADLDAIVARASLQSQLRVTMGQSGWFATHTLAAISFAGAGGAHATSYDLAALGAPVISVDDVPCSLDGRNLTLARHGFTLRLPSLWAQALDDIALSRRHLPADPRMLLAAVVDTVTGKDGDQMNAGCVAIDQLVAEALSVPRGSFGPACEKGLDTLAAGLSAELLAPTGYDFFLAGTATPLDENNDLVADVLAAGTWSAELALPASRKADLGVPFIGNR